MYNEEDTILDNTQTTSQQHNDAEKQQKNNVWKHVAINAGTGFAVGTLGALLMSATPLEGDEEATVETPDTPVTTDGTLPVAHSVDDSMSFGQAFHAAHEEVGPGGVFEWHGQLYNTYTEEEWNSLSTEQQQAFIGHLKVEGVADYASNVEHHAPAHHEAEAEVVHDVAQTVEVVSDEPSVEVLGVEQVTLDDGGYVTVGGAVIEGQEVIVIDVNNDGMGDLMAMDVNGDGQISDNEILDISADPVAMSNFETNGMGVDHPGAEIDYLA